MNAPRQDIDSSKSKKLRFYVARKNEQRRQWIVVNAGIYDLDFAIDIARSIDAVEAGVFREASFGGFIYWTTADLATFNSEVLDVDPR